MTKKEMTIPMSDTDELLVDAVSEALAAEFEGSWFRCDEIPRERILIPDVPPDPIVVKALSSNVAIVATKTLASNNYELLNRSRNPLVVSSLIALNEPETELYAETEFALDCHTQSAHWALLLQYKKELNWLYSEERKPLGEQKSFLVTKQEGEYTISFQGSLVFRTKTLWESQFLEKALIQFYGSRFFDKKGQKTTLQEMKSCSWVVSETLLMILRQIPKQYRHCCFELIS